MSRASIFVALAAALALSACSASNDQPAEAVVRPVLTTVATAIDSESIGPFVGTVQSRQQTVMSFQLPGRVLTRDVAIGDLVKQGQLLATLDSSVQEFQLGTAQANLASALAQFSNLAASEARVAQLLETNTAAQAQLDAATTARQTAEAQRDQAKANVERAQDQLGYTRIVAETDGVVVSTAAEPGQVVSAGEPVLVVAQPDHREAVFDLPETLAASLKVGDSIAVSSVTGAADQLTGAIREIAPSASATARLRQVRVTLDAPGDSYRLGSTVEAVVQRALPAPVIAVPATAVRDADKAATVWIADPAAGTVSSRPVTVGSITAAVATITDGLAPGDIVVTAGVNSLTEGQPVLISQGIPQ